jgi:superfamily I DNA/RNA helicase
MSVIYLDPDQEYIINCRDKTVLVEAPPGSGKTVTGVLYAQSIIEKGLDKGEQLKPHQKVLFLTFSKNARAELQIEADRILSKETQKRIEITNFHSFFRQKVWAFRTYLGLPLNLEIISPEERYNALESFTFISKISSMPNLHRGENKRKQELEQLSNILEYNNPAFSIPHYPIKFPDKWKACAQRIREFILNENRRGQIYFDDFGYYFYRMISESNVLLEIYQEKYPVIIVDEFQDSSDLQFEIVKRLKGNGYLLLFADELQQIYEWRGAALDRLKQAKDFYNIQPKSLNTLHRFKDKPKLKCIFENLRFNYREGQNNPIDCRNCSDFKIQPFDAQGRSAPIGCFNLLRDKVKSLQSQESQSSIGILFYRNDYMRSTKRHFRNFGIWCREISKGNEQHNFFRRLIISLRDIKSDKLRIILYVYRSILTESVDRNYKFPWDEIEKKYFQSNGPIGTGRYEREEVKLLIENINNLLATKFDTISSFLGEISKKLNALRRSFKTNGDTFNLYESLTGIATAHPDLSPSEVIGLIEGKFLQFQFARIQRLGKGIYVLTIHQAKGKEFDHVILPYVDSRSFRDTLNFKKLFYVGVTRTKQSVTIMYPVNDKSNILDQFHF